MGDCNCDCPSGDYNCSCCCASVTGLRAGIHPDYIKSVHLDLALTDGAVQTYETKPITEQPIHIISATASLACIRRDNGTDEADHKIQMLEPVVTGFTKFPTGGATPLMFSLFTIPAWNASALTHGGFNPHLNQTDGRRYICTGALTAQAPSWQNPDDLFGYFCDGGLYLEINTPSDQYGVRVSINYVDRVAFSPAFGDPVKVLQHYWKCSHDEEFLEGYYGGNVFNTGSSGTLTWDSSASSATPGTWVETDPWDG